MVGSLNVSAFIKGMADLSRSGDPYGPDGEFCAGGFQHDRDVSLEVLDDYISDARVIAKRFDAPRKNFVEGQWSFRISQNADDKRRSFDIYPKGERSHMAVRATLNECSDGTTWLFTTRGRRNDARATFAEAKACVLKLLAGEKI